MFAKVYETEEFGQILVKLDSDAEGVPGVKFSYKPKTMGICSATVSYAEKEDPWDEATAFFAAVTLETALSIIRPISIGLTE